MSLPFTELQCFYVAILAFIVVGIIRGWRRELISLVFVLLAAVLIRPSSGSGFGQFIARLPSTIGYLISGQAQPEAPATTTSGPFLGQWGTLLLFLVVVALGYVVGNKAFPKPATPTERLIGVAPAIVSGAFILSYIVNGNFLPKDAQGQSSFAVVVQPPDPSKYVPIIFVIAIVAVIAGLIASRAVKKPAAKK